MVVAGALVIAGSRIGLGQLPGDIFVDRGNVKIFVPLATSIILSIILTVAVNVWLRLGR
jgi:hypothetical protein